MGNVGVASRKPEPAPFRGVAACRGSVARRRYQTLETGFGLAGTLTPYRGSGSSESSALTLAQSSHPFRATNSVLATSSRMDPEDRLRVEETATSGVVIISVKRVKSVKS